MIALLLMSVICLVPFSLTLSTNNGDPVFTNELNDLLRHFSEQASELAYERSQPKRLANGRIVAPFFNTFDQSRADHYWTRRRGRDKYSTPEPTYDRSRWVTPGLYPVSNDLNNKEQQRKKRETVSQFSELEKLISRLKREVQIDVEQNEMPATHIESSSKAPATSNNESALKSPLLATEEGTKRKNPGKNFRRKLTQSNKCCVDESDFSGFNETLLTAKSQCLVETRKGRKTVNASDETIDGDGGLYNMFSCDRMKRWKTVVTCTLDCIALRVGMIDSQGVINADVAKQVVLENFANQKWEQEVSGDLVDECTAEVASSESKPVDAFGYHCSSKVGEFVYCMWRKLFLSCPADKQVNSKQCEKLRIVLAKSNDNKFRN